MTDMYAMYALDAARFIIKYADEIGCSVSNMQLQSILYFTQAYYLMDGSPCFPEPITAHYTGARVDDVYQKLRILGSHFPLFWGGILQNGGYLIGGSTFKPFSEENIRPKDRNKLIEVVNTFLKWSDSDMSALIKKQTPWKKSFSCGNGSVIPQSSIWEYFK